MKRYINSADITDTDWKQLISYREDAIIKYALEVAEKAEVHPESSFLVMMDDDGTLWYDEEPSGSNSIPSSAWNGTALDIIRFDCNNYGVADEAEDEIRRYLDDYFIEDMGGTRQELAEYKQRFDDNTQAICDAIARDPKYAKKYDELIEMIIPEILDEQDRVVEEEVTQRLDELLEA